MKSLWRSLSRKNNKSTDPIDDDTTASLGSLYRASSQDDAIGIGSEAKAALSHIRDGEYVLKYCRNPFKNLARKHRPHQRLLMAKSEQGRWILQWESPKKKRARSCIKFCDIVSINPGTTSAFFAVSR
eukprot:Blabericola_migrator_1__7295@NODE_370_length_9282_cov_84_124688_g17_i4_p8_GENE_NODE_370_length_9282_cov_84_124688_g17_i4NODE_370_length_9282_cov_84_124688_g17_i4_p8_ORF_typecomplete_len128_score6_91_NODE_370_length_9282_cov_84_124688_g17_i427013084